MADRLVGDHRVIVPDRPGYGSSPGPARGPRGNAEALAGLIRDLEVAPVTAVGHSYGAAVALRLAEAHPEAVVGLVLVCPAGSPRSLSLMDRALAAPGVGEAVGFATMRAGGNLAHWLARLVPVGRADQASDRVALPPDRIGPFAESWRRDDAWRSFAAEQRALVAEIPETAAALGGVRVPVTILAGRRDRVVPPPAVEELAAALPAARVVWVEDGGHLLLWRRAELVAETVAGAIR